ncbi:hypothetical protein AVEN_210448-1 [Araneus ventricosus]|uniref:Transposable element Tcb1 transposase n=1 Tax=Araneus ventricosus TaxID=182803 RepID=A0A4Y2HUR9_ARAVE|nr:hypothetical protein AVEN_210448-1 [Araneus ventricosus]
MAPRRETSIDARKFILRLFKKGKSHREIAKIVGRSHACVQKIIGKFKSDGLIENKSGRRKKCSRSDVAKSDGRRIVWRKPKTSLDPKNLRPTIKHGGGLVMVWGSMASTRVRNLVFIDGIMNHMVYLDILHNSLKESAKNLGLDGNFIVKPDKDPKHMACNVKMWCLFHCKQQLHTPPPPTTIS